MITFWVRMFSTVSYCFSSRSFRLCGSNADFRLKSLLLAGVKPSILAAPATNPKNQDKFVDEIIFCSGNLNNFDLTKQLGRNKRMKRFSKIAVSVIMAALLAAPAFAAQEAKKTVTTASGLKYVDVVVGKGASPTAGKQVKVHYTGTLENGKKFDSSVDRNEPFSFTIGVGQVIKGWDEGVMTMKVGGKRKLIIPSNLGYGARGAGGAIPPNATLLFDVELLDVAK
jgi:FKBP-type peptidyl-prolyl cis-trans isomerase